MTRIHGKLLGGVSALALLTGLGADEGRAQVACVAGGQVNACTVAAGQTVADVTTTVDGSTVGNAGTITNQLRTNSANSAVTNSGTIGDHLYTQGANSGVTNSGTIGDYLQTRGDNSGVTNSGSVGTYIRTFGANSGVTNSGTIGTSLLTSGANSAVTNSGTIGTVLLTNSDNSAVTNSGSVGTFLRTFGANSAVTNTGSVGTDLRTQGANSGVTNSGSVGTYLRTIGANSAVTNSGAVGSGAAGDGVLIQGANPNLTLLPGSNIQGVIDLSGAGTRTLNVGNGLSIANTFVTGPNVINSNGAPFAVNGLQVAVVDPTNLAAQDELLVDLTGGISSAVLNRLGGVRNGVAGVTSNPRPMSVGSKDSGDAGEHARQYWVQGFGARRDQDGEGLAVDTNLTLHGFVSGMDAHVSAFTRAGFFLGGSFSDVSAEFSSQDTETDSFFGGAYVSTLRGRTAIDMAVTVGYSDYDRERMVANNLAAGGIDTAKADYDGFFVSPEITVTRPFWPMGRRIEQSVTLRYAGLFLDGFTETGTAAPLTVQDRDVHVGQARAQLAVPLTYGASNGAVSRLMLKGGAQVRTQFGDRDVSGTLLAQNIAFDPGGERTAVGGFVGLSAEHVTPGGMAFHASAEGLIEDDGSNQISGKVGIKFRF